MMERKMLRTIKKCAETRMNSEIRSSRSVDRGIGVPGS